MEQANERQRHHHKYAKQSKPGSQAECQQEPHDEETPATE